MVASSAAVAIESIGNSGVNRTEDTGTEWEASHPRHRVTVPNASTTLDK
jgi:hypothetical protein